MDGVYASLCDVFEPCEVGTIIRSTSYPDYWRLNVMRVERETDLGVEELTALGDSALGDLEHRTIVFRLVAGGERLRSDFTAAGWHSTRLVWMRHEPALSAGASAPVREVPAVAVRDLRRAWHAEDFDGRELSDEFLAHAEEAGALRGARVMALHKAGVAVGYTQLERYGDGVEISEVFVHSDHRGAGRGTALTRAAIEEAGDHSDLWICADDEDRPKELYARLGFRPAWTTMSFLRLPPNQN
jgi:GNAT superfamily N-acetyltransferase